MLPFKKYNEGYAYIMVGMDVFSRFAFAEATNFFFFFFFFLLNYTHFTKKDLPYKWLMI